MPLSCLPVWEWSEQADHGRALHHECQRCVKAASLRRVISPAEQRFLEVRGDATVDDAAMVASCLVALGGDRHTEAAEALRAGLKLTASPRRASDVA